MPACGSGSHGDFRIGLILQVNHFASSGRLPEVHQGFAPNELNKLSALVQEHQAELLKAWHDYFKSGNGNRGGQAR